MVTSFSGNKKAARRQLLLVEVGGIEPPSCLVPQKGHSQG